MRSREKFDQNSCFGLGISQSPQFFNKKNPAPKSGQGFLPSKKEEVSDTSPKLNNSLLQRDQFREKRLVFQSHHLLFWAEYVLDSFLEGVFVHQIHVWRSKSIQRPAKKASEAIKVGP